MDQDLGAIGRPFGCLRRLASSPDPATAWGQKPALREAIGELLESGQSGLVVVAVNKKGTDIQPLLSNADKTVVTNTTWGDLDAEMAKEIADAKNTAAS